jgi:hypothetical protein
MQSPFARASLPIPGGIVTTTVLGDFVSRSCNACALLRLGLRAKPSQLDSQDPCFEGSGRVFRPQGSAFHQPVEGERNETNGRVKTCIFLARRPPSVLRVRFRLPFPLAPMVWRATDGCSWDSNGMRLAKGSDTFCLFLFLRPCLTLVASCRFSQASGVRLQPCRSTRWEDRRARRGAGIARSAGWVSYPWAPHKIANNVDCIRAIPG